MFQSGYVEKLAEKAIAAYGGFDSWVNNAGYAIVGRLEDVTEDDSKQVFEANFWGVVNGSLVVARPLKSRGGAIINLGSVASEIGLPLQGIYSASEHAVKGVRDSLRIELKSEGAPVCLTLIQPASVDTPFVQRARNHTQSRPTLPPPVYRPEDVAEMILYAAEHGGRSFYVGSGAKVMAG